MCRAWVADADVPTPAARSLLLREDAVLLVSVLLLAILPAPAGNTSPSSAVESSPTLVLCSSPPCTVTPARPCSPLLLPACASAFPSTRSIRPSRRFASASKAAAWADMAAPSPEAICADRGCCTLAASCPSALNPACLSVKACVWLRTASSSTSLLPALGCVWRLSSNLALTRSRYWSSACM